METRNICQAQLFVDDEIIKHQTLLERVVHSPVRNRANPVFVAEKPWELPSIGYVAGVYRDEDSGKFRAWYVTGLSGYVGAASALCTITSTDGIHWERPELDLCREIIGENSNVLFTTPSGMDGPAILKDTKDTAYPWKFVFYAGGDLYVAKSEDGIEWLVPGSSEEALQKGFGDRTTAFFDASSEESLVILSRNRQDMYDNQWVRSIYRLGSRDCLSISSPSELIFRPDLEDGPYVEFYQMSAFRYESLYLGFIERYHSLEPPFSDIELAVSRDTRIWRRIRPRTAFFSPPPGGREMGLFDYSAATPCNSPPLLNEGSIWIYYCGGPSFHGDRSLTRARCIGLAKLRIDGFVSLRAGRREGVVETHLFRWPGGKLNVNHRVLGGNIWSYSGMEESDGWLRIEILDNNDKVIQGYSKNDNDPLFRDAVRLHSHFPDVGTDPTWEGKSQNLDFLIGKDIAFRFFLRSAEIYSFRAVKS